MLLDFTWTDLSSLFTSVFGILTSCWNWVTDNVFLMAMLGISVVLPTVFALYQRIKR